MDLNALTEQDVRYNSTSGYVVEDPDDNKYIGFYYTKQDYDGIIDDSVISFVVDYKTGWFDHTDSIGRRDCGYFDHLVGKKNALKKAKETIKYYGRPREKKELFFNKSPGISR